MALLDFWKASPGSVLALSIEQVVNTAGDGNLRDGNPASEELRQFLREIKSDALFRYARSCLDCTFDQRGYVLQDIVNELGRRLDFDVEPGLYRGRKTAVGFDGIWRAQGEPEVIVEVKTAAHITVPLDKLAEYKEQLVQEGQVSRSACTLVVVGHEDTGALEAQIRGSRYAWEMRLISVERLIKLVQIKEKSDDASTLQQIRQLLQPFEYTKIDRIIDVVFTAATDVESQPEIEQLESGDFSDEEEQAGKQIRTAPELLNSKRQGAVDAFGSLKGWQLVKRSRTLFWTPDKKVRVCCAVSKRYQSNYQPYWYAYHPHWDHFLAEGESSFFVLVGMDLDEAYALPHSLMAELKPRLNMTDREERSYWHVALTTIEMGKLAINVSSIGKKVPLEPYRFPLKK